MLHDPDQFALFPHLPAAAIQQLHQYGTVLELPPGALLFSEGEKDYPFWVVLDGEVRVTKQVSNAERLLAIHHAGHFSGEISMLTGAGAIATGRTTIPSRLLRIDAPTFRHIMAHETVLAEIILTAIASRTKDVDAQLRQQEKLAALGKLSAGLAHELNNPAAAAQRAAQSLRAVVGTAQLAALQHDCRFNDDQRAQLLALHADLLAQDTAAPPLDPLARSDREEELASWLDGRGIEQSWELAPSLLESGLDRVRLEQLDEQFPNATLGAALSWLEPALMLNTLARQVEQSTHRISDLVGAMKAYSYMDQAAQQKIDLHEGIEDTLTILGHKLKQGVLITREYDRSLPRLLAYGSELNQVWTNLIDNAIAAMQGRGNLVIRTHRDGDGVCVEIIDDGPGIPPAIQPRIWEPFFTTKSVGQGSGLGLDIALRIVCRRHNGDIRVHSQPGNTRFEVWLPFAQTEAM